MRNPIISILLLCASLSFAQGVRFGDANVVTTSTAGSFNIQYVPSALISVYNAPCTSLPCSTLATTYTDSTLGTSCPTSAQIVLQGTAACVSASDPNGNWGVWVASGQYCYAITIGLSNFGPYCFSAALTPPNGATAVLPVTKAPIANQFLNGFTSSTGVFTSAQPSFSNLSGNATAAQGGTGSTSVPSAGQLPVGNGTAYAPVSLTQDCSITSAGVITCTKTNNVAFTASATTDTTNAANISSGTLASARGGAGAITGALKANGAGVVSQAACADLSNAAASCSTDTTNASNISSGTVAAARGGAGTVNGALKGNGSGTVSQAACGDLSNAVASCSTDTTSATNITAGALQVARIGQGANGQCLITTGGASAWGSCTGTGTQQVILNVSDPGQTVNASTTSVQLFSSTFTPSGSQIPNTTGSKFRVRAYGAFQVSTNATTINIGLSINGSTTLTSLAGGVTIPGANTDVFAWWGEIECTNTSSATYQCVSSLRYTDQTLATQINNMQAVQVFTGVSYGRTSLGIGVAFSTASTSNSAILREIQVEQLN